MSCLKLVKTVHFGESGGNLLQHFVKIIYNEQRTITNSRLKKKGKLGYVVQNYVCHLPKHDSKSLYSLDYFLQVRKRLLSEEELIDLKVLLSDNYMLEINVFTSKYA